MTWAASWRRISRDSGLSRVRIATRTSWSRRKARPLSAPSTLIASAALARPGPIAAATSAPVTGPGKLRILPSGRVTTTGRPGAWAACGKSIFMPRGLPERQSRGNLVHGEIGEIRSPQDGDARAARRGERGIGVRGIEDARMASRGGDQMHGAGIVANGVARPLGEADDLAKAGAAGQVPHRGTALRDDGGETRLLRAADHHGRPAVARRQHGERREMADRPALFRAMRRAAGHEQQQLLRQAE